MGVIDLFVDELDLPGLGFSCGQPAVTGRPGYHPGLLPKLYIYGYLNRIQSSRRLEREAQRNVEVMWLTGHLAPDFKTIADFRRDNGTGIRNACKRFVALCRELDLFRHAVVAIDGSKFKAVNNRDKNFTPHKLEQRIKQIEESIERYMHALDIKPIRMCIAALPVSYCHAIINLSSRGWSSTPITTWVRACNAPSRRGAQPRKGSVASGAGNMRPSWSQCSVAWIPARARCDSDAVRLSMCSGC